MVLLIVKLNVVTLSIIIAQNGFFIVMSNVIMLSVSAQCCPFSCYSKCFYAECHYCSKWPFVSLCRLSLSRVSLLLRLDSCIVILSVIMLNVIIDQVGLFYSHSECHYVIILSVSIAQNDLIYCYADCLLTEYHYYSGWALL